MTKTYKSTWEWQVIADKRKDTINQLWAWLAIVGGAFVGTALILIYLIWAVL